MQKMTTLVLAAVLMTAAAGPALGQHAGWTLFGEPTPAAADVPAQQKAVHPITSPFFHEDAFITTDLRLIYLHHRFPNATLGGELDMVAAQVRVALTNTISLMAVKDGYAWFEGPLVEAEGYNDIAAAVKWNVIQDWDDQLHISLGAGYEMKVGDGDVFQNDDELRGFVSVNKGFDRLHLGLTINFFTGLGDDDALGDSQRMQWHVHADYYLLPSFSPVVELNGYHVLNAGSSPFGFQAIDIGNFGMGEDDYVITLGVGGEVRIKQLNNLAIRAAYEVPLTDKVDLFNYRWTLSAVFSF